jgi:hypothetical protein
MSDITYRLPDGSIKSFPETTSEQEIRRFVAKDFPRQVSAVWLSEPTSSYRIRFDDDTLEEMARLYDIAKPYADRVGVDPFLAIGGPAEELASTRRLSDYRRPGNYAFDWWTPTMFSEAMIERNVSEAKNVDQSNGIRIWDKLWNPTPVDLGPANIN